MKSSHRLTCAGMLLTCWIGSAVIAEDSAAKLPDQYAQVVLRVEGMI